MTECSELKQLKNSVAAMPDDTALRRVYADALESDGRNVQAKKHRKFADSKDFETAENARCAARRSKEAVDAAAARGKEFELETARAALMARHADSRCWSLAGYYGDDGLAGQLYTLAEVRHWRDWASGYLQYARGTVTLGIAAHAADGAELVTEDWSQHFEDFAGTRKHQKPFDFAFCARDLARYTAERAAR